ncbi:MAG: ABC transporter ATP-binding protein [Acidimicrobiales bacterium]
MSGPLLEVRDLVQVHRLRGARGGAQTLRAVDGVSFEIGPGESVGLVGESGCGKSSLARALVQLPRPTQGQVRFRGQDLCLLRGGALLRARLGMQMVFQDPHSSVNPRMSVAKIVAEPLRLRGGTGRKQVTARVRELLDMVRLPPSRYEARRAGELSGGECQRVAVARALAGSPELLICDEAVSALDVSVQAQLLNLFEELRSELGLAYLFISHDLAVVRHMTDRVLFMYLGLICEEIAAGDLDRAPRHPYTAALMSLVPGTERDRSAMALTGEPPSAASIPSGCRFHTRCWCARDQCTTQEPALLATEQGGRVACLFPLAPQPEPLRDPLLLHRPPGP